MTIGYKLKCSGPHRMNSTIMRPLYGTLVHLGISSPEGESFNHPQGDNKICEPNQRMNKDWQILCVFACLLAVRLPSFDPQFSALMNIHCLRIVVGAGIR
jgi:hypothetical protein